MANPSASNVAYAELAPHSIHLAVLAGRKLVAVRAFALEAKADLAAFVAEHQLTGTVRASFLGSKNFLHRSGEAESGAVRQPAALQGHAVKLPHGFSGAPSAVAVDAATGAAPDAARVSPWLLAAVDSSALAAAREVLISFGLSPADLTLAATAHLGAVAGSLSPGETALVLIPGEELAQLAWVTTEGVQAVAVAPVGYAKIYEAVQQGLGLKFKAAAGKLFYNESYDFGDAAPKIAEPLSAALKGVVADRAATHLHIAGLIPAQAWLVENVAKGIGLRAWAPAGSGLASRLGLDATGIALPASAAGLVQLAAAGSAEAAWVQPTLEALAARPRTAVPFPADKPSTTAQGNKAVTEPAKSVSGGKAAAQSPVAGVSVSESQPAARKSSNKGPIFIAAGVGLVAAVVGLAMHFRSPPSSGDHAKTTPPPAAPVSTSPKPAPTPTPVPTPAPTPPPVVVPPPAAPAPIDLFASDSRKFGNERYRFEVTDKGFIQALATPRDEVLVESAAGISLQGSYVGTDGRRKWFNVGGVDDVGYQATVKKSVKEGITTFDVKVTHPRFELEQSFQCLPEAIKVSARFTPVNLRDPRGVIAAVHSVRLSPVALNPSLRMRASADTFSYAMKAGTLGVKFDNTVWARDGADGRQTVIAGENGVAFHFTETSDANRNLLKYEIALP